VRSHLNGRRCGIKQTCFDIIVQGRNPAGAGELDRSESMIERGVCRSKRDENSCHVLHIKEVHAKFIVSTSIRAIIQRRIDYLSFFLLYDVMSINGYSSKSTVAETDYSRTELGRVSTRALAAVGSTGWETSVTFTADLFVTVVLGGEHLQ
jgi:hypothetical protein